MKTKTEVLEVLRAARDEVLTDESRWTKGEHARDASGAPAGPDEDNAVAWCAEGACFKAARLRGYGAAPRCEALAALYKSAPGFLGVFLINDMPDTEFPDVIDLFDRAIKSLEDPA